LNKWSKTFGGAVKKSYGPKIGSTPESNRLPAANMYSIQQNKHKLDAGVATATGLSYPLCLPIGEVPTFGGTMEKLWEDMDDPYLN
jgi:hypothetical protein